MLHLPRAPGRDVRALQRRGWLVVAALTTAGCAPSGGPAESDAQSRQAVDEKPTWTATGPMSVARQDATATRLADGRVLVAGGQRFGSVDVGDVYFETVELFDPAAATFSVAAAKMVTKRSQHAAVALAGGEVLVAGGVGGVQSTSTAEIFDPKTATWTATPPLAHEHWGATLTALPGGRVLLVGGDPGAPGGAVELFDPSLGAWKDVAQMSVPRRYHTATLLANGRVLVTGGQRPDDASITASAELYNPSTGLWTPVAPLSIARTAHTATLLDSGLVLVVGGSTSSGIIAAVERYSPAQDAWTKLPGLASARALHAATRLDNGAVLIAGGLDASSSALRSSELFDPATERWVVNGLLGHGRIGHTAEGLAGGAVLVSGGEDQSTAEMYRPAIGGQACEVGTQCATGHCVDGVCCDTTCSGPCLTCARSGAEGTCSPASPGTDPHRDCGQGGPCDSVCDAAGACVDRVGQACVATACTANGTQAIEGAACAVIGGACTQITVPCAPYRCGEKVGAATFGCLAQCRSIDDCADGYACDSEGSCRARPDVAATDPETCAASPRPPGAPNGASAWLAGLALVTAARRASRRAS
jgi:N-acetylneuraminic acid mutarotase